MNTLKEVQEPIIDKFYEELLTKKCPFCGYEPAEEKAKPVHSLEKYGDGQHLYVTCYRCKYIIGKYLAINAGIIDPKENKWVWHIECSLCGISTKLPPKSMGKPVFIIVPKIICAKCKSVCTVQLIEDGNLVYG